MVQLDQISHVIEIHILLVIYNATRCLDAHICLWPSPELSTVPSFRNNFQLHNLVFTEMHYSAQLKFREVFRFPVVVERDSESAWRGWRCRHVRFFLKRPASGLTVNEWVEQLAKKAKLQTFRQIVARYAWFMRKHCWMGLNRNQRIAFLSGFLIKSQLWMGAGIVLPLEWTLTSEDLIFFVFFLSNFLNARHLLAFTSNITVKILFF